MTVLDVLKKAILILQDDELYKGVTDNDEEFESEFEFEEPEEGSFVQRHIRGIVGLILMLVLGTNHDGWQDNLSLATKLHVQLEKQVPGICRPIKVRAQRYNQDLCPCSVLVEVGATGNSRQEALLAAKLLANAIISLAVGT